GAAVLQRGQLIGIHAVRAGQPHLTRGRFEAAAERQGRRGQHGGAILQDRPAHGPGHAERRDLEDGASRGRGMGDRDHVVLGGGTEPLAHVDDLLQARPDRLAGARRAGRAVVAGVLGVGMAGAGVDAQLGGRGARARASRSSSPASSRAVAAMPRPRRSRSVPRTMPGVSVSVTALVTRAVRSWASSKTTTSCSGMMPWASKASMASRAWLVTTR